MRTSPTFCQISVYRGVGAVCDRPRATIGRPLRGIDVFGEHADKLKFICYLDLYFLLFSYTINNVLKNRCPRERGVLK